MRMSQYFAPTLRNDPAGAVAVSHRLSLRAGIVRQEASGIFIWLPLGLRVLRKIERIVREEMDLAGAVEVLLPTIQLAERWKKSGRYDDYGAEMLRIVDRHGRELLYGPTAEEVVTELVRMNVSSYQELPLILYNIQWKFRDEVRPRFGVLRAREFLMKDAYSFDMSVEAARTSYNRMLVAYLNLFARIGVSAIPVRADPGPIGGDLSHEFIVLAPTGESLVYCDRRLLEMPPPGPCPPSSESLQEVVDGRTSLYASTDELHDPDRFALEVAEEDRVEARGVEVGHIFFFGQKYSEPMNAALAGSDGKQVPLQSGSYGVGISRLVSAVIEASHDERGIIWPEAIAPFFVVLVNLAPDQEPVSRVCEDLYQQLQANEIECLLDDRSQRPGAKLADSDLIGIPWRVVVGTRTVSSGMAEIRNRRSGETVAVPIEEAVSFLRSKGLPAS